MDFFRSSSNAGQYTGMQQPRALPGSGQAAKDAGSGDRQFLALGKDIQSAQKELEDNPGAEAQKALESLLKRADKLTPIKMDSNIGRLESQQKASNSVKLSNLTRERDAILNELPDDVKYEVLAVASLLDEAKTHPKCPFTDCAISRWRKELRKLSPAYAEKQEKIEKLSSNEEIELLKEFRDLPFKGRLSLAMSAADDATGAQRFAELSESFSDWELNRVFSRMTKEQAQVLDTKLQHTRIALFQTYWEIWNPDVQAKAQQIDAALGSMLTYLPLEKQQEAQQLIRDLCEPKAANDVIVSRFLLQHISPQLAQKAHELSELRVPLRNVERQDKAIERLRKHLLMFGPKFERKAQV
jgi:hypothetical protein